MYAVYDRPAADSVRGTVKLTSSDTSLSKIWLIDEPPVLDYNYPIIVAESKNYPSNLAAGAVL